MSPFQIYTVRVVRPDDSRRETTHVVANEDEALEAMAKEDGFRSYRAWQAAHPSEAGWNVVVEVG